MTSNETAPAKSKSPFGVFTYTIAFGLFFWYVIMPSANAYTMAGESGAGGYAILAEAYPSLKHPTQMLIQERIAKGFLTRTDVSELISAMLPEKGSVQTSPAPDFGDPQYNTFDAFDDMWMRWKGEHATYKSKAALLELVAKSAGHEAP
ncbi:TPA: hypothetical protein VDU83_002652 [Pseudomonas aeruginosa]|nr:hypothetical protein [Pseudomonas aeruginosa]